MNQTPGDGPFLCVEGVTKRFGSQVVLKPTNLEVAQGEFLTLLGPSGCGKTTLLRIIAGFERADAGAVRLRGADQTNRTPERRPFNMVFQSYALFPHMSVADNVAYGLRAENLPRDQTTSRVDEMLTLLGLEALADRAVAAMSGGQQQRVALARSLVKQPEVLLLDEPLAALDLKLRKRLQEELRAIQRRVGTTFIFVTHDQDEAMELSDRICLMREGEIDQIGSPREVYRHPASRFAAEFFGEANVVPCVVQALVGDHVSVQMPWGGSAVLSKADGVAAKEGASMLAVVRPEALVVGSGDGLRTFAVAELEASRFQGAQVRHRLRLPDGSKVRVITRNGAELDPEPGAQLTLSLADGVGTAVASDATSLPDSEALRM